MEKTARIFFFVALAGLLWLPTGIPVAVIATDTYELGSVAHLGLLASTYAVCLTVVLGIAHLVRQRRRAS